MLVEEQLRWSPQCSQDLCLLPLLKWNHLTRVLLPCTHTFKEHKLFCGGLHIAAQIPAGTVCLVQISGSGSHPDLKQRLEPGLTPPGGQGARLEGSGAPLLSCPTRRSGVMGSPGGQVVHRSTSEDVLQQSRRG